MASKHMSALAQLGANSNSSKQKPTLPRHQNAIAATARGEPYPATDVSRTSKAPGERVAERRQKPKSSSPVVDSSGTLQGTGNMVVDNRHLGSADNYGDNDDSRHLAHTDRPPLGSSLASLETENMVLDDRPSGFRDNHGDNDDSTHQVTRRPPLGSSFASLQMPLMPGAFHAENASPSRILGRAPQVPLTSNSDPLPNEPAQPGLPAHGPTVSLIQTGQTFLTQTIQTMLPEILPGLIQGEIRIHCAQLAQEISTQISSIRDEVIRPTGDPDDPMLPSCEEGEIEGSRGRDKRSARRSYSKRKGKQVRLVKESDSEADEMDEGSGNEGDEGISKGSLKYKKKIQALREPLRTFLLQKGVVVREEHGLPVLPLPPCAPAVHVKQFNEKHSRTGPDPFNIQYNWRRPLGQCPWNRQATLLLAQEYLQLYREGRIKVNRRVLQYNSEVDLKMVQKTIRQRLVRTQICWKGQDLPNNSTPAHRDDDDDVPCTMQERADSKVTLTRRRMRGITLLKVRERNVEKYLEGDVKEEFLSMLRRLRSAGMNCDTTDSESSDRTLQPCTHWWLSDDVITILQELDTLGKRAKAKRLVTRKGNRPLPRTKNIRIVYDSTKTIGLPKNWYRREWYESLCPFEQGDLDCADPETLPNLRDLHAAIQYFTGGSSRI